MNTKNLVAFAAGVAVGAVVTSCFLKGKEGKAKKKPAEKVKVDIPEPEPKEEDVNVLDPTETAPKKTAYNDIYKAKEEPKEKNNESIYKIDSARYETADEVDELTVYSDGVITVGEYAVREYVANKNDYIPEALLKEFIDGDDDSMYIMNDNNSTAYIVTKEDITYEEYAENIPNSRRW